MAKIIIHGNIGVDELNERRLMEDFKMSYEERMAKAFKMMRLARLFTPKSDNDFRNCVLINKMKVGSF